MGVPAGGVHAPHQRREVQHSTLPNHRSQRQPAATAAATTTAATTTARRRRHLRTGEQRPRVVAERGVSCHSSLWPAFQKVSQ